MEMEMGWNGTHHRPVPPKCKGIKPITQEMWSTDAHAYHDINIANQDAFHKKYDDRSVLSKSKGYRSEVTHSGLKKGEAPFFFAGVHGMSEVSLVSRPCLCLCVVRSTGAEAPDWDSSPHRPIPSALRGLSAPLARWTRGPAAAERLASLCRARGAS
jgi:hypothetical protein